MAVSNTVPFRAPVLKGYSPTLTHVPESGPLPVPSPPLPGEAGPEALQDPMDEKFLHLSRQIGLFFRHQERCFGNLNSGFDKVERFRQKIQELNGLDKKRESGIEPLSEMLDIIEREFKEAAFQSAAQKIKRLSEQKLSLDPDDGLYEVGELRAQLVLLEYCRRIPEERSNPLRTQLVIVENAFTDRKEQAEKRKRRFCVIL